MSSVSTCFTFFSFPSFLLHSLFLPSYPMIFQCPCSLLCKICCPSGPVLLSMMAQCLFSLAALALLSFPPPSLKVRLYSGFLFCPIVPQDFILLLLDYCPTYGNNPIIPLAFSFPDSGILLWISISTPCLQSVKLEGFPSRMFSGHYLPSPQPLLHNLLHYCPVLALLCSQLQAL